ncbi:MAG: nitroreductase family deazaflavin-dependent oxidoreductase [Thermomicrobiales bacterium]
MPIPRAIARANRNGLNRLTRRFAGSIPPFVLLTHTGRRSGATYTVPLMAFRHGDAFVIALTYGETTDWQRNIEAGGPASLTARGTTYPIGAFRTADRAEVRSAMPWIVHRVLDLLGADRVALVEITSHDDGNLA